MTNILIGFLQILGFTGTKDAWFQTMCNNGTVDVFSLVTIIMCLVINILLIVQMNIAIKAICIGEYNMIDAFTILMILITEMQLYVLSCVSIQLSVPVSVRFKHMAATVISICYIMILCLILTKLNFSVKTLKIFYRFNRNPPSYKIIKLIIYQFATVDPMSIFPNTIATVYFALLNIILMIFSFYNKDKLVTKLIYFSTFIIVLFL